MYYVEYLDGMNRVNRRYFDDYEKASEYFDKISANRCNWDITLKSNGNTLRYKF